MKRYTEVAEYLRVRVLNGDYQLKSLPSERQLAQEAGVSYMTARKAVQTLIAEGLLIRDKNGIALVNHGSDLDAEECLSLPIAFLVPILNSRVVEWWESAIETAARRLNRTIRTVLYTRWDDVLLAQALESFQGLFLLPISGVIPLEVITRLQYTKRLVVVDEDLSMYGIPSIRIFSPLSVQLLLNHLESLGHERIACLNVQQQSPVILQRIEQWQLWMNVHGFEGPLLGLENTPVIHESDGTACGRHGHAYEVMMHWLDTDRQGVTAVFCTTMPSAIGAIRAITNHGLTVGSDIAVCAANGEGYAQYLTPSITALETPDAFPYLKIALDWISGSTKHWRGALLLQPVTVPMFIGESTDVQQSASTGGEPVLT